MKYVDHYKGRRKQATRTDPRFFQQLHDLYGFTLDGAATAANALLPKFSSRAKRLRWDKERVYCNPPWSSIRPFIEKAPTAELAVFLVPARTNCTWWHRAIELGAKVQYFVGRPRFVGHRSTSPVDCVLLVFGEAPAVNNLEGQP